MNDLKKTKYQALIKANHKTKGFDSLSPISDRFELKHTTNHTPNVSFNARKTDFWHIIDKSKLDYGE